MSCDKKENICDDDDIDWTAVLETDEDTTCQPLQTKNDKDRVNTDSYKRRHEMSGVSDGTNIKKSRGYSQSNQKPKRQYEDDPVVLSKRQKQIDFGKNTIGYDNYIKAIPKELRKPEDPQTPNKYIKYSRRSFDVLLRNWRLQLHKYDNVFVEKD